MGYYGAALSVDYRWLGRKKLTSFSFLWVSPCSALLLQTRAFGVTERAVQALEVLKTIV